MCCYYQHSQLFSNVFNIIVDMGLYHDFQNETMLGGYTFVANNLGVALPFIIIMSSASFIGKTSIFISHFCR